MTATTIVEGKRYDLSKLYSVSGAKTREEHGVNREGVWVTKSGKVIVKTCSIWQRGNTGGCVGTEYHFANESEIANLADELHDEKLMALVPIAED